MAEMGVGYGSEAHLLRFLGRHRRYISEQVLEATALDHVEWLDFNFDPNARWQDAEWTALDFVESAELQAHWRDFWPTTGTPPNWDAIGRIRDKDEVSWLLVETKGNVEEIRRSTQAGPASRQKISATFDQVKANLGVDPGRDWLEGYYQFCFQVAVLWFLQNQGVPARLLYVYFTGDRNPGFTCPQTPGERQQAIGEMHRHVGLPEKHVLADRIHHLFVPVNGNGLVAHVSTNPGWDGARLEGGLPSRSRFGVGSNRTRSTERIDRPTPSQIQKEDSWSLDRVTLRLRTKLRAWLTREM